MGGRNQFAAMTDALNLLLRKECVICMEQKPSAVQKDAPILPRRTGCAKGTVARDQFAVKKAVSNLPGKDAASVPGTGGNESKSNAPKRDALTTPRRKECVIDMVRNESGAYALRKDAITLPKKAWFAKNTTRSFGVAMKAAPTKPRKEGCVERITRQWLLLAT